MLSVGGATSGRGCRQAKCAARNRVVVGIVVLAGVAPAAPLGVSFSWRCWRKPKKRFAVLQREYVFVAAAASAHRQKEADRGGPDPGATGSGRRREGRLDDRGVRRRGRQRNSRGGVWVRRATALGRRHHMHTD